MRLTLALALSLELLPTPAKAGAQVGDVRDTAKPSQLNSGLRREGQGEAKRYDLSHPHPFDGTSGFEPGPGHVFSVAVPPGNYRITLTFGRRDRATTATVKAESRRLMLDALSVSRGKNLPATIIVNTRNARLAAPPTNAPGGDAVRLKPRERGSFSWDDKLTLEFLGDLPSGVVIEPVAVPTLFLLGDSTVTDQPAEPAASWGQMLPAFLTPDIAVANHAESGETLKSFLTELRFDKVLESARPGDVALIQFGHNDQKANWPQTFAAADTTYRDYLGTYIAELRRRGVTPILVTSPERRMWSGDRIRPTLADYAAAVRAVGAALQVPVIDLNAGSIAFYEALGPARAPLAFNDGGKDATHHDNYGAWVLARIVAAGLARLPVGRHVRAEDARFDPAHPPAPERFRLAPSTARDSTRPDGN